MAKPNPDIGLDVQITLTNGTVLPAYWDGLQWWAGINDNPQDIPIVNSFVADWDFSQEA